MDFNRKANDILLKLSDIYLEEDVSFDLAIGEKLIGKHCKYVQLCKGGVYDRRYIWNKTLIKKDPYCIYNPGGEDFNKIEITDIKFNSVHHGYLPTMFFKP